MRTFRLSSRAISVSDDFGGTALLDTARAYDLLVAHLSLVSEAAMSELTQHCGGVDPGCRTDVGALLHGLLRVLELRGRIDVVDPPRSGHHELKHPLLEVVGDVGVSAQALLKAQGAAPTWGIRSHGLVVGVASPLRELWLRAKRHSDSSRVGLSSRLVRVPARPCDTPSTLNT